MNLPGPHISLAVPEDREALLELHKKLRFENDFPIVPEYAEATRQSGYYENLWHHNFPAHDSDIKVLKAEVDNRIVAFARFGRPDIEWYPDDKLGAYKEGLAELHQIYVLKDFRGKFKIGSSLYVASVENLKAMDYRHMLIALYEENTAARLFYEKMGATHHYMDTHDVERGGRTFHNKIAVYIHRNINNFAC